MDAIGMLISEIGAEIDELEEGEYGEVILEPARCGWLMTDEQLNAPQPDVLIEPVDPERLRWIAEERRLNGLYIPMQSPGQVILFQGNLRRTFWTLICRIHPREKWTPNLGQ